MSAINIALLGCGTVGSRVADLLMHQRADILRRTGFDLNLRRILVRDPSRNRTLQLDPAIYTNRFADIVNDDGIDLAIEVLGGTDPACSLVQTLLARGVHVVTANKTLLAHHGDQLHRAAARGGALLAHEASVGAAIPIVNALRHLAGEPVRSVRGIINGSCNFILTHMAAEGVDLDVALREARTRGLVEPDPSADLSGRDAAEKLCVLAATLSRSLRPADVETRGIESITLDDLRQARDWGFSVRSVATLDESGASVGPCLVPLRHWLAGVRGERNAVAILGAWSGETILQGNGAGPDPTASAIIGDVISILRGGLRDHTRFKQSESSDENEPRCNAQFVRIRLESPVTPHDLLEVLRSLSIGIKRIELKDRILALLTEPTTRIAVETALRRFGANPESAFIATIWNDDATTDVRSSVFVEEKEVRVPVAA